MTAYLPSGEIRPRAYRIRDFIQLMAMSRTTFFQLSREGKIRTIRLGTHVVVPADEVERLLKYGTENEPEAA